MKFYFAPYHIAHGKIKEVVEANKSDFAKHYGEVDPNWGTLVSDSLSGAMFVSVAVDKNEMAGFAIFSIGENITRQTPEAQNVAMYIVPEHRGKIFDQLMEFSKSELSGLGVKVISATVGSPILGRALRKIGYKKPYEVWEVEIE